MRENRLSGSEGGGTELNRPSLPLFLKENKKAGPFLPCLFYSFPFFCLLLNLPSQANKG